jgi:hypothetical protein
MSNKELLPCPFCGSEAKYGTNDGFHYIWCDDCGAEEAQQHAQTWLVDLICSELGIED